MALKINTIKKHSTFVFVKEKGKLVRGNTFNVQMLNDMNLQDMIKVGYTATKRLGNAVKRNKAKRLMKELTRKVLPIYGKINFYYVLIAKISIFETSFLELEKELKKIISWLKYYLKFPYYPPLWL